MLYRAKGCDHCMGSGYLGRTGIFEVLVLDESIRQMVMARSDAQTIRDLAVSKNMTTLYDAGLLKVTSGITTLEEIIRVTQKDYTDPSAV
jgi:general secretion pathway protein E